MAEMNKKRFLKWATFIVSIMCIAVSVAYATQVSVSADYSSATGGHVDGDTSGDNNKGTTQHPGATAGATSPGAATATTTGAATATNVGTGTTDATAQQTAIQPVRTRNTGEITTGQNDQSPANTGNSEYATSDDQTTDAQVSSVSSSVGNTQTNKTTSNGIPKTGNGGKYISHSIQSKHKHRSFRTTYNGRGLDKRQKRERSYEKAYYKYYNSTYPNFNYFGGGDCTNWASQIAHTGGYHKTSRGKEKHHLIHGYSCGNPKKWYAGTYKKKGKLFKHKCYSTTWTTVGGFWNYFTKARHRSHFKTHSVRKVMEHVRVGDVIQFYGGTGGHHEG
jgi:hypothetical protein